MKRDQLFLIAFLFLGYSALTGSPATTSRPLTSPDLVITDVTVTDGNGPNIGFSITFKNQGADPTANYFLLKIYLSTDATISGSDHKIDQIAYAYYMDPDESFTYVKTNFPAHGVLTGSYYLGAIIDTDNWVPESDESNNSAYDSSVMLAMTAVPDLSAHFSPTKPSPILPGPPAEP